MKKRLQFAIGTLALLSLAFLGAGCDLNGDSTQGDNGGGHVVAMSGGAGDNTTGGSGGDIYVDAYTSVSFKATGAVNASFSVPNPTWTANLGTNGATVAADCVVAFVYPDAGDVEPAAGRLYVVPGYGNLYKSNGDNVAGQAADVVTGLQVNAGVTLTVPAHYTWGYLGAPDAANLNFTGDLLVNGTIKTAGLDNTTGSDGSLPQAQRHEAAATVRDKAGLNLEANRIMIGASGVLDAAGASAAAGSNQRGGDGGGIWITADEGFVNRGTLLAGGGAGDNNIGGNAAVYTAYSSYWNGETTVYYDYDRVDGVWIWNDGLILNAGPISAGGGNGTTGGEAGYIDIESYATVCNIGALTANGGTGSTGDGGSTDYVEIYSEYGSALNAGAIASKGGDGKTGGGSGADLYVYGGDYGYIGNAVNSGAIDLSGGSVTGTAGDGGNAGSFDLYAYGKILNAGAIAMNGGAGKGNTSSGGDGGDLYIEAYYGEDYEYGEYASSGPVSFSGNLSMTGGSGGSGGSGGDIDVYAESYSDYDFPAVFPVTFYGYAQLGLAGGNGVTGGGSGGDFDIYTEDPYFAGLDAPVGSITNESALVLKGGDASNGTGGHGGYVDFEAEGESYIDDPAASALGAATTTTNYGTIDATGGKGYDNGGHGGGAYLYGHYKVVNNGAINAKGGDATSGTGTAGYSCSDIEFYATYNIESNGAIIADGGNGTGTNGSGNSGADIYMYAGQLVTCGGAVSANGGTAKGTGTSGDGGYIDLYSGGGATAYGSLTAAKGTGGTTAGTDGEVWVDWNLLFGPAAAAPPAV